ncbi:MAG: hypothetical protein JSS66_19045 [Armatimonadetes bacterium]|nr:hypothetical protein [Armatimonadota bacterium]
MSDWLDIASAPKDGQSIWAYLNDRGIQAMHWASPEEYAEYMGWDPRETDGRWVLDADPIDDWEPEYWLPFAALPTPPEQEK